MRTAALRSLLILFCPVSLLAQEATSYDLEPLYYPKLKRDSSVRYWYVSRQYRHPYAVEIIGPKTSAECEKVVVLFRETSSGEVTPDSTSGRWLSLKEDDAGTPEPTRIESLAGIKAAGTAARCVALARWTMGTQVGEHHLRVNIPGAVGSRAIEYRARGRALPRILVGVARTNHSGRATEKSRDSTFKVTRPVAGGSIEYDSTKKVTEREVGWGFTPVAGIDFPLVASWPSVRTSLSVSLTNARKDWFAGFSFLQPFAGLAQEAVGVDVQLAVRFERTTFIGWGAVLVVDSSLLGVISAAFIPK